MMTKNESCGFNICSTAICYDLLIDYLDVATIRYKEITRGL